MVKAIKECLKNWLVTHERLYWYIVVGLAVLAFGIVTALGCAKVQRAEASVAYMDQNKNPQMLYYEKAYDYIFVLESTPTQGKKIIYSTVPFECYSDFIPDSNGNYALNLCAPGGNVYIIHEAFQNLSRYEQTLEKTSGTILHFNFSGQGYYTNKTFGNGIVFESSFNIIDNSIFKCISYLKSQGIAFEQYPYYLFTVNGSYTDITYELLLLEKQVDIYSASRVDDVGAWVCAIYKPYENDMSISTGDGKIMYYYYQSSHVFSRVSGSSKYVLYTNADFTFRGSAFIEKNEYSFYDKYSGLVTITPTPTPIPVPEISYNKNLPKFETIRLSQDASSDGTYFWRFFYDAFPKEQTSVYSIARIGIPSPSYVKSRFYSGDSEIYMSQVEVDNWRMSASSSDITYFIYEQTDSDGVSGFLYKLKDFILAKWKVLYGDIPESYITEVTRYAFVGAVAVRAQNTDINGDITVGATTVSLPVKYYMSYSDYYEELDKLDGYVETQINKNTYGLTMQQILDLNSSTIDKEVLDSENAFKEQDKVIEDLKAELEKVNAELEAINSGGFWASFGSLASGLESSSASLKLVASAVGNVFSFLPPEVYACMCFVFVSLCVIAVYHAIRG